jgi:hypothetical protein
MNTKYSITPVPLHLIVNHQTKNIVFMPKIILLYFYYSNKSHKLNTEF